MKTFHTPHIHDPSYGGIRFLLPDALTRDNLVLFTVKSSIWTKIDVFTNRIHLVFFERRWLLRKVRIVELWCHFLFLQLTCLSHQHPWAFLRVLLPSLKVLIQILFKPLPFIRQLHKTLFCVANICEWVKFVLGENVPSLPVSSVCE